MKLGNSYRRDGVRIEGTEGDRSSTGRLAVSEPGPLRFSESETRDSERSLKERHIQAECRLLHTCVADINLGLHVDPEKLEQGLSQKLLPVCGICSSSWVALSGFNGRGYA